MTKGELNELERDIDGLLTQYDLACKEKDERLMDEIGEEINLLLKKLDGDVVRVVIPKETVANRLQ